MVLLVPRSFTYGPINIKLRRATQELKPPFYAWITTVLGPSSLQSRTRNVDVDHEIEIGSAVDRRAAVCCTRN